MFKGFGIPQSSVMGIHDLDSLDDAWGYPHDFGKLQHFDIPSGELT